MTRLISEWLREPEDRMRICDRRAMEVTGMSMATLAFRAAGLPPAPENALERTKAAVVRFTSGEGAIDSFAESVAAVIRHMGVPAFIAGACDVAGIHEAISSGAEIIFMADDDRYIAVNVKTGAVAENDFATVCGYSFGLSAMAGGLKGKEVTLLGYGRLGRIAFGRLSGEGANVKVYDKGSEKPPLPLTGPVFDATSEGGWLGAGDIAFGAKIAAPGVPLSLDDEALSVHKGNVLHDPLQLGTAVMLALALKGRMQA